MSIHQIERVSVHTPGLLEQCIRERRPVVITDLFQGAPIDEVRTLDQALKAFGQTKLKIIKEYVQDFQSPEPEKVMTLDEYVRYVAENPKTPLMCTEYDIPARISTLYQLPQLCLSSDLGQAEVLDLPRRYGDHDLLDNVFIGNPGNVAHMHYDGDQRNVLLHQVFGEKTIILFQPTSTAKLKSDEGVGGMINNSGIFLEHMSQAQQLEFVDQADGFHTVLLPGETIFMPALIWHYLQYDTFAMSFNIRFGRGKYGRFLSIDNFHRDSFVQLVSSLMSDAPTAEARYPQALAALTDAYTRPAETRREKVRFVRELFKKLSIELCPEVDSSRFCPPSREEQQLELILQDIEGTFQYADVQATTAARLVGAPTPTQKRILQERIGKCGYTPAVLEQVLFNKLGKRQLEELNKTEAARLISYLSTPGASW